MSFPTVGVIGAGPLTRMMAAPALALGVNLRVLATEIDDSAVPAIKDVFFGDYLDLATVREFAKNCDLITFIHEDVSPGFIRTLEAEGIRVRPSADVMIRAKELRENSRELREDVLDFDFKVSVLVARSPHGQAATWAATEVTDGLGKMTITPAPDLSHQLSAKAQRLALDVAGAVNLVGVMSVEMYVVGQEVVANQVVLGPHESGNWTIDGATTSQFEEHLRAILDLPLGSTDLLASFVVSADVVGTEKNDLYRPYLHVFARDPGVKVHQYGQAVMPGRKLGHVTVIGSNLIDLRTRAAHAAEYISGVIDE